MRRSRIEFPASFPARARLAPPRGRAPPRRGEGPQRRPRRPRVPLPVAGESVAKRGGELLHQRAPEDILDPLQRFTTSRLVKAEGAGQPPPENPPAEPWHIAVREIVHDPPFA